MTPADFEQSNDTLLGGPAGDYGTASPVGDLPIWRGKAGVVSCWRATWRERLRILFTGRVWLRVAAPTHPPVKLEGKAPW